MHKNKRVSPNLHFSKEIELFLNSPSRSIETVKEFEEKIVNTQGAKWGVSVNSCTSGLMAALLAAGIERGDEVIIPPISWPQTYFPAFFLGANLRTVDLNPHWPVMSPDMIKKVISSRTKAVISVGLWGFPTGLKEINDICKEKGIFHILDAAQLFNAMPDSRGIGNLADLVVLSFSSTKRNYGLGEGGMVLGNSRIMKDRILFVTQHPYRIHSEINNFDLLQENYGFNFNFRLNPIAGIIGLNQLSNNGSSNYLRKENINFVLQTILKYEIEQLGPPNRLYPTKPNKTSILINTKELSQISVRNLIKDLDKGGLWARRCPYRLVTDISMKNSEKPFPWYKNVIENSAKSQLRQNLPWAKYWKHNLLIISSMN